MMSAAAGSFAGPGAAEAGPPPSDDGVSLEEALAECLALSDSDLPSPMSSKHQRSLLRKYPGIATPSADGDGVRGRLPRSPSDPGLAARSSSPSPTQSPQASPTKRVRGRRGKARDGGSPARLASTAENAGEAVSDRAAGGGSEEADGAGSARDSTNEGLSGVSDAFDLHQPLVQHFLLYESSVRRAASAASAGLRRGGGSRRRDAAMTPELGKRHKRSGSAGVAASAIKSTAKTAARTPRNAGRILSRTVSFSREAVLGPGSTALLAKWLAEEEAARRRGFERACASPPTDISRTLRGHFPLRRGFERAASSHELASAERHRTSLGLALWTASLHTRSCEQACYERALYCERRLFTPAAVNRRATSGRSRRSGRPWRR